MIFTQEEKQAIWIDYIVTQLELKYTIHEFPLTSDLNNTYKKYPIFGIATKQIGLSHRHRTFEEFCNEEDERVAEGVIGWYYRFKTRIFKTL